MAFARIKLLLIAALPFQSLAFGPRLEPIKGGYGSRSNLFAIAHIDESDEHENMTAASCRVYTIQYGNQFAELEGEVFRRRIFIAEPFIFDSSMFGVVNPFDVSEEVSNAITDDSCTGDNCDECLIPEGFKHVESPVDVMAYLGIKRVEPIRTLLRLDDWE